MAEYYMLKGRLAVPCGSNEWSNAFKGNRTVKKETVCDSQISTVFLGLNHTYGDGPPMIFETMVFGGHLDQEQERYSTYDEAEAGHAAMVERVMATSAEAQLKSPKGDEVSAADQSASLTHKSTSGASNDT